MSVVTMIVAMAENRVIGRDGGMPWHIPADLKRFKALTMDKPMIMGRRTFESLPGLLPGRRHIVLTRDRDWEVDGVEVVHGIGGALLKAGEPEVTVIGGAEIFRMFMRVADVIELTQIHAAVEGDTFMPEWDQRWWREVSREKVEAEGEQPAYSYIRLIAD